MANKLKNQNLDASTSLVRKNEQKRKRYTKQLFFEEQVRTGAVVGGKIKFADFAQRWFTGCPESRLRARTVARYKELINRVNSELGHMPLDRIRPTHLLEFYRHLECAEPKNATYQCTCDLKEKAPFA